jgi:hypothetical protein
MGTPYKRLSLKIWVDFLSLPSRAQSSLSLQTLLVGADHGDEPLFAPGENPEGHF